MGFPHEGYKVPSTYRPLGLSPRGQHGKIWGDPDIGWNWALGITTHTHPKTVHGKKTVVVSEVNLCPGFLGRLVCVGGFSHTTELLPSPSKLLFLLLPQPRCWGDTVTAPFPSTPSHAHLLWIGLAKDWGPCHPILTRS